MLREIAIACVVLFNAMCGTFANGANEDESDIAVFETCPEGTANARPYAFTSFETQRKSTGFFRPTAIITIRDVSKIERKTRESVVPITGIAVYFRQSLRKKASVWQAEHDRTTLLVVFAGTPRATIPKEDLAGIVLRKDDKLWVGIVNPKNSDHIDVLEGEIRALDREVARVNKRISPSGSSLEGKK